MVSVGPTHQYHYLFSAICKNLLSVAQTQLDANQKNKEMAD